jgi:hypothetical protein
MKPGYIQGYAETTSLFAGDLLKMRVSTTSPHFKVQFYRQGKSSEYVGTSEWFRGFYVPPGTPGNKWLWPSYSFTIPFEWRSGVYIAVFVQGNNKRRPLRSIPAQIRDARESEALFVIKGSTQPAARILYKIPIFTYFAYTHAVPGDKCFYGCATSKITLHKPGGGAGGTPWDYEDFPDWYDRSSPRHTFAHWDRKFIVWLEENGYSVDFCTDLDIHQDTGSLLKNYHLLLSVGHDEYWSERMRSNVEAFIESGKNVAFFSGNICWWRVTPVDNDTAIVCDKSVHKRNVIAFDQWCRFDPENRLTGVSYRNGGGKWTSVRERLGYTVQSSTHWVFSNTDLEDGDTVGEDECLVGYECDGIDVTLVDDNANSNGRTFAIPTTRDGTPCNFKILAIAWLNASWDEFHDKDYAAPSGGLNSVIGIYENNGVVFTAATTDWARVLSCGNRIIHQITRNVIDKLHLCA